MNIKGVYHVGPPKKVEKQSVQELRQEAKVEKGKSSETTSASSKTDHVQISNEAKELQENKNEQLVAKELLTRLPSARAHVVYEALAKIKAGFYSSEEIVDRAAEQLLDSGDLGDV